MTSKQAAYREFLQTEFWRDLSERKKDSVGRRCEECSATELLHSHHVVYPSNWNDTTLDQLVVLCFYCHAKEHGFMRYDPFEKEWNRLFRAAGNASTIPDRGWDLKLARLVRNETQTVYLERMLRHIATLRIKSPKAMQRWCKQFTGGDRHSINRLKEWSCNKAKMLLDQAQLERTLAKDIK